MANNHLPLRWIRLIVMFLLLATTFTTNHMYLQMYLEMFKIHGESQNESVPAGVKIVVNDFGLRTTTIIVIVFSGVVSCVAFNIVMLLVQDMYHVLPKSIARRLRMTDKTLSTSTLASQIVGLTLSTMFLIVPLSAFTVFVFGERRVVPTVTVNGALLECPTAGALGELCLPIIFREIPYVRINAELPWAAVLLGIAGTLVTTIAWYRRPEPDFEFA